MAPRSLYLNVKSDDRRPRGRPTEYTDAAAVEICERLASGEALRQICADEHIPAFATVLNWVVDDRNGFADRYSRAREMQGEGYADAIVLESQCATNKNNASAVEVRVKALQWAAQQLRPKKYGIRAPIVEEPADKNKGMTVNISDDDAKL